MSIIELIKGNFRSLDYSSYEVSRNWDTYNDGHNFGGYGRDTRLSIARHIEGCSKGPCLLVIVGVTI